MEEFNNIELFQNYLLGDLSPSDKEAFEDRLKEDSAFNDEFNEFKLLEQDIEEAAARKEVRRDLKSKFNRDLIVDDYIEDGDQEVLTAAPNIPADSIRKIQIRRWSIAASILLIAVFSFVFWPSKNIEKPIAEFLDIDSKPQLAKKLNCEELILMEKEASLDLENTESILAKELSARSDSSKGYGPSVKKLISNRDRKKRLLEELNIIHRNKCSSDSFIPLNREKGFLLDTNIFKN
jgi:hypothetical protein